jgi:NADH:ubiquinone oxidoreductase subunit B-like Fe-S oxidoreductase
MCVYLAGCSAAAEKLLLLLLQLFSPTSATTNNQKKKLQNKQLNTHKNVNKRPKISSYINQPIKKLKNANPLHNEQTFLE